MTLKLPIQSHLNISYRAHFVLCAVSVALCLLPTKAFSKQNSTPVFKYTDDNGVTTFSDVAPEKKSFQQLFYHCYACDPNSQIDWQTTPLILDKYKTIVLTQAVLNGIEPSLLFAIIHAESHFNADATSKVGAQGLMQIMPITGKALGLKKPFNPQDNIKVGATYYAKLLNKYRNTTLACAAYNAGMSNIEKYNGVPPFKETQVYLKRISILRKRYQVALNS